MQDNTAILKIWIICDCDKFHLIVEMFSVICTWYIHITTNVVTLRYCDTCLFAENVFKTSIER